jgi:CheY-like chemotaxis protein
MTPKVAHHKKLHNTKYEISRSERVKILIAEDESDILYQYRLALEGRDHHVVTNANGEECSDV